jgi:uncharacterized protein (TIGR03437 family)
MPRLSVVFSFYLCITCMNGQALTSTVAGGTIQSGISAQNANIGVVQGLAIDSPGNVVFCETSRNVIRRIDTNGTIETIAGTGVSGYAGDGGPAAKALLFAPAYPSFDSQGNLYFADVSNYRIRKIDTTGVITTVIGTGIANQFGFSFYPYPQVAGLDIPSAVGIITGLAIDGVDNLYWAEVAPDNVRIRRLTTTGDIQLVAGGFTSSVNIAVSQSGQVYAEDETVFDERSSIEQVNPDGTHTVIATATQGLEASLATDSSGNVYFIGLQNAYEIERLAPDGTVTIVAGGCCGPPVNGPISQATFVAPSAIAVDAHGNIFFADGGLARIGELTANGNVQILAGLTPAAAPDGAPALASWFIEPSSIALGPDGTVYVAETAACTVRKIGSDQTVRTAAGTGTCIAGAPALNGTAVSTALQSVYSIAVDQQGVLYIAQDSGILEVGTNGIVSELYPNLSFSMFTRLAISENTALGANVLLVLDPEQRCNGLLLSEIGCVFEIGLDGSGGFGNVAWPSIVGEYIPIAIGASASNLTFYVGTNNGLVYQFDSTNPMFAPLPGTGYGSAIASLAVSPSGTVWLADGFGQMFENIAGLPLHTVFASSGGLSGDGGPPVAATYNSPTSLAFATNGDLYFLDQGNNRVRKFSAPPVRAAPVIASGGIVNSASILPGPIAPGELISIYGSNFRVINGLQTSAVQNNSLPKVLGNVRVLFDATPGAITALTANQVNVFVPYFVAGSLGGPINVTVEMDGVQSAPVSVQVVSSAPGFFSVNGSGSGQGAILNQDSSVNSSGNPAFRGSVISLFGTGEGLTNPALPDGALSVATPYSMPISPVTVTIGGIPAIVQYAGAAPGLATGVLQINAVIPMSVSPGDVPISVTIGQVTTARQVTVAVQ